MDAELLALCKQTVTRIAYVDYNEHNDFTWTNDVINQDVVLTLLVGTFVHLGIVTGSIVVTDSATGLITYVLGVDYTIDYTVGKIARTANSTIPSGVTVHVSYGWQTITIFMARIEFSNELIRDNLGQETVSTCQIYCDGASNLTERDKILLTGTTRTDPEILSIQQNPDECGNIDHKIIYIK